VFSGIVEEKAVIIAAVETNHGAQLTISSHLDHSGTQVGDSIAIEGVCLTATNCTQEHSAWHLTFDVASETLRCTTLGEIQVGGYVHLERSLAVGDRLHGHIVSGHVDCVGVIAGRTEEGDTTRLAIEVSEGEEFLARKGSVTLAGISLTVGEVRGGIFQVYLIPHTKLVTRFGSISVGDRVNVEFDMLARYVHRMLGESLQEQTLKREA
jgi:riboflavin synthase